MDDDDDGAYDLDEYYPAEWVDDYDDDYEWDDDELGYEGDYSDYDTLDDEDFL